jgi:hypothetical protein
LHQNFDTEDFALKVNKIAVDSVAKHHFFADKNLQHLSYSESAESALGSSEIDRNDISDANRLVPSPPMDVFLRLCRA